MTETVNICVTVNGTPRPLTAVVAGMVLACVNHQDAILKQGVGVVTLNYDVHTGQGELALSRVQYRVKLQKLILPPVASASGQ